MTVLASDQIAHLSLLLTYSYRSKSQINDIPFFYPAWLSGRYFVTVSGSASLQPGSILTVQILYVPTPITVIHDRMLHVYSPGVICIPQIYINLIFPFITPKYYGCFAINILLL
jgi:hypothetical protein